MARPLRIEFEGAWYHVMNRGAARQAVFVSDAHRDRFLQLLADLLDRFGIETQHIRERHGPDDPEVFERKRVNKPISLNKIIGVVTTIPDCEPNDVHQSVRGRQNLARMLVTHLAHRAGRMTCCDIAKALAMNHYSAAASSIRRLEKLCEENTHIRRMEKRIRQEIALNQT